MDLNKSQFSASLFFGDVSSTVALRCSDKVAGNEITESRKRKLIETPNASVREQSNKQMCKNNKLETIVELASISSEGAEGAYAETLEDGEYEKTLIANVNKEILINEGVDDDVSKKIQNEESSIYETISETYCSDTSVFVNISSTNNIPSSGDLTLNNDSVIFVSENFPPHNCYGQSNCNQANHYKNMEELKKLYESFNETFNGAKRMVIIDGSNVAFSHSCQRKEFSVEGISICLDYFIKNGYDVKAVVPQMRLKRANSTNSELLEQLKTEGKVLITPCKCLPNGKSLTSYDDRFILDLALKFDGAVISNDNFRDLFDESDDYKRIIQSRVIGFMFCNDTILFPKDPYGRYGPTLDEILIKKY